MADAHRVFKNAPLQPVRSHRQGPVEPALARNSRIVGPRRTHGRFSRPGNRTVPRQRLTAPAGLAAAALVEPRKEGLFVHYRLADPAVYDVCRAIRTVAEHQLAELDRLVRDHFGDRSSAEAVSVDELLRRARSRNVVILDTRPPNEYASGHIAGAISMPIDDLQRRLRELPKDKEYVAYCRGPYCVYADRAVDFLARRGVARDGCSMGFQSGRPQVCPCT